MTPLLVLGGIFVCSLLVVAAPLVAIYHALNGGISLSGVAYAAIFAGGPAVVVVLSWRSFFRRKESAMVLSRLVPFASIPGMLLGIAAAAKYADDNPAYAAADGRCMSVLMRMDRPLDQSAIEACRPHALLCMEVPEEPIERGLGAAPAEDEPFDSSIERCIYQRLSR